MSGLLAHHELQSPPTVHRPASRQWPDLSTAWIVAALTVVGGVARFATAARVPLWNDEAHTFRRVSGTFAQLNEILGHDAFPPLHYYAYWVLAQAMGGAQHLTPFWMRFIPCLAGALMIPAMYWLAAELCDRSTALLTAAFTACSSFLMTYSHDAKMYMPLWLFCALSMACCLFWLRTGKMLAWVAWVATSAVMVGLHASGLAVVALVPLIVLTAGRPTPRRVIALVLGLAIIAAGPAFYYVSVNHWVRNNEQFGWNRASGIHWVAGYNAARSGGSRVLYLTSAYLCGWEWPPPAAGANQTGLSGNAADDGIPLWVTMTLGAVVCALLVAAFAGALAAMRRARGSRQNAPSLEPWRSALCLGVWLAAPAYAAYRISSSTGQPQLEGQGSLLAVTGALMFLAALGLILYLARNPLINLWNKLLKSSGSDAPTYLAVIAAITLLAALAGCAVEAAAGHPDEPSSVWVPRYLGVVWPAFAIVLCSLLLRLPGRALPAVAAGLLLLVNIAVSAAGVTVATEPPIDRIVNDLCMADDAMRVYVPAHPPSAPTPGGGCVSNGVGRYYLSVARANPFGPRGFDEVPINDFVPARFAYDPATIAADVQDEPTVRRLIVWDCPSARTGQDDPLLARLGPGWRRVSEDVSPVRYHWNWSKLYTYRRREYAKDA